MSSTCRRPDRYAPQLSDAVSELVVALFVCVVIERTTDGRSASPAQ
ncbi:hypothetical protein [Streptomyces sp. NPDC002722]